LTFPQLRPRVREFSPLPMERLPYFHLYTFVRCLGGGPCP
jgi:hypothetical protein